MVSRGAVGIDVLDEEGMSVLMWAALRGDFDIVEFLITQGASPTLQAHGKTAFDFADTNVGKMKDRLRIAMGANGSLLHNAKRGHEKPCLKALRCAWPCSRCSSGIGSLVGGSAVRFER